MVPEYLMYWCQAHKADFVSRAAGNTFLEISKKNVRAIPIVLPPEDEQHRIADVIQSVDNLMDALQLPLTQRVAHCTASSTRWEQMSLCRWAAWLI